MRYIVEKTEDGLFEFTHIETKQTIDGKDVEVVKGKSKLDYNKMVETIEQLKKDRVDTKELLLEGNVKQRIKAFKEEVKVNLDLLDNQISTLQTMIDEVEKIK